MGSPSDRRSAGIWDAVQLAEDRAVRDFLHTPEVRALGPYHGDEHGGQDGDRAQRAPRRHGAQSPSTVVVVAPEVVARISARRAAGASYVQIATETHLTFAEVTAVLSGWQQ